MIVNTQGRIWFSLNGGISVVDPERLRRDAPQTIVHIQTLAADDRPIEVAADTHVPGGHHPITLTFAALTFASRNRIRYRYFLERFDREWSIPTVSGEASYTNLAPGSYRLRVMATNPEPV